MSLDLRVADCVTWGDAVVEAMIVAARPAVAAPLPSALPLSALSALGEMVLMMMGGLASPSSSDDSTAVWVESCWWCSSVWVVGGMAAGGVVGAVSGMSAGGAASSELLLVSGALVSISMARWVSVGVVGALCLAWCCCLHVLAWCCAVASRMCVSAVRE